MKFLPIAALGLALFATTPTQALTLQQAQAELAGGFCKDSTCTFKPVQSGTLTSPGQPASQPAPARARPSAMGVSATGPNRPRASAIST